MNWIAATSLLLLIGCYKAESDEVVLHPQEVEETTEDPTPTQAPVEVADTDTDKPLPPPVPTPIEEVAEQEQVLMEQEQQVQELEDDLMSLLTQIIQKRCESEGGEEAECKSVATQEAQGRYQVAEEAAEERAAEEAATEEQ